MQDPHETATPSEPDAEASLEHGGSYYDESFRWRLLRWQDCLVLELHGRPAQDLPEQVASAFLERAKHSPLRRVVIDFSTCEHIASSAFSFLVRFFRVAAQREAQVVAAGANARVLGLMQVLGLSGFLFCVEDREMARRFFAAQQL